MKNKKFLILFILILLVIMLSVLYIYKFKHLIENNDIPNLEKVVGFNFFKDIGKYDIASAIIEEIEYNDYIDVNSNKSIEVNNSNESVPEKKTAINKNNSIKKTSENKEENNVSSNNDKKVEKTQETLPNETLKEEYRFNSEITNKIINTINNNLTSDMVNYGYSIVIDKTIVNLTNQFTYTEKRVIDKINLKFGVIRVYSRDYYKNGNYMWTECFLI